VDVERARILVVCTGNICRSPYIEHVLRHALDEAWGPGAIEVTSAGTRAQPGDAVSEPIEVRLRAGGLTAAAFASHRLGPADVRPADLVLTATKAHRGEVVRLHPGALRKAFTFRELGLLAAELPESDLPTTDHPGQWVRDVTGTLAGLRGHAPSDELDIVDPYRRDQPVYDAMFGQVAEAMPWVRWALTGGPAPTGADAAH
jgi:protein-tyrosine phosphatase